MGKITKEEIISNLKYLGINDGNFPKANRVEGYLNDKDRE